MGPFRFSLVVVRGTQIIVAFFSVHCALQTPIQVTRWCLFDFFLSVRHEWHFLRGSVYSRSRAARVFRGLLFCSIHLVSAPCIVAAASPTASMLGGRSDAGGSWVKDHADAVPILLHAPV